MSVNPTTRLGYQLGARRRKIPVDRSGVSGGGKFASSRGRRMAGQKNVGMFTPGQMSSPYGVGHDFVPEDSYMWEIEDGPNTWQTFRENLDPDSL